MGHAKLFVFLPLGVDSPLVLSQTIRGEITGIRVTAT